MSIVPCFLSIYFKRLNDQLKSQVEHCLYHWNHFFVIISFGKGIDYHQTYHFDYEEQMSPNLAAYSYFTSCLHLTIEPITPKQLQLTLINILHYIITYPQVYENEQEQHIVNQK